MDAVNLNQNHKTFVWSGYAGELLLFKCIDTEEWYKI